MAGFLDGLFQGIGDTFKAGASVNVAKINRQIAEDGYKLTLLNIDNANADERLQYINAAQQQAFKLAAVALAAVIIGIVVIAIIFKK